MGILLRSRTTLLLTIGGLALILRLPGLDKSIWLDEAASLNVVGAPFLSPLLLALKLDDQLPAYYFFLKLWSSLSTDAVFLRMPSVVIGVATVVVIAAWLWDYSPLAAALAGLLVACSPSLLRVSQEIRDYGLLVLATAVAFFCASRVLAKPSDRLAYVGLTLSLIVVVATHLVGAMVVPAVLVFMALDRSRIRQVQWPGLILAVLAPCATFGYIAVAFWPTITLHAGSWWMPPVAPELVGSIAAYHAGLYSTAASLAPLTDQAAGPTTMQALIGLLWIAAGGMLALFGDWHKGLPFLAAAATFCLGLVGYSLFRTPVLWYRTADPALVPFVGFLAVQMTTLRLKGPQRLAAAALGSICLICAARWMLFDAQAPLEDWKSVARFLQDKPADVLSFYPGWGEGPLDYYRPGQKGGAVTIGSVKDLAGLDSAIAAHAARTPGGVNVLLVIRADWSIEDDPAMCGRLLADLAVQPAARKSLLVVRSDVTLPDYSDRLEQETLSSIRRAFGEPAQFQDHGSFAWMAY